MSANETLYVQNLDDKIKKLGIPAMRIPQNTPQPSGVELRELLYLLFSQYGRVVDVVCVKTPKMRGQAHVAFQDIPAATSALRALQGFQLNGKAMHIAFAKTKSRAVLALDDIFTSEQAAESSSVLEQTTTTTLKRQHEDAVGVVAAAVGDSPGQPAAKVSRTESEENSDMDESDS